MTRDDIIRMAQQAGFQRDMFGRGIWDSEDFNRFAALVAAHEREACVEVCELGLKKERRFDTGRLWCAMMIRKRGEK